MFSQTFQAFLLTAYIALAYSLRHLDALIALLQSSEDYFLIFVLGPQSCSTEQVFVYIFFVAFQFLGSIIVINCSQDVESFLKGDFESFTPFQKKETQQLFRSHGL